MTPPWAHLGLNIPVIAAPMARSATDPAMVIDAHRAGGLRMLAAGYKAPDAMATEIAEARAASIPLGVNVFAPNPIPIGAASCSTYRDAVQRDADVCGLVQFSL